MNTKQATTISIILAYIVVYFVWGSTFFFIEKALHSFPPFILGAIRFVLASGILMGYCAIKGYKLFNKKVVIQSVIVGFLLLFCDMAGLIWAEQYVSSGISAIIASAAAIWFIVLDKPKWKQNFSSLSIVAGVIVGFVGVILLFSEQLLLPDNGIVPKNLKTAGLITLVFGSVAWTIGSLYSKYYIAPKENPEEDLHIMVKTAWQMVTAGILFTVTAGITGEYSRFEISNVRNEDWFAMAYLITFGSLLAFSCYIWLLQVRPALEVSTYAYVNPIVALLLSHFFGHHQTTGLQIIGLLTILSSVLLMNWSAYRYKIKAVIDKKYSAAKRKNNQNIRHNFKESNNKKIINPTLEN